MLKISITTIPHDQQRYNTTGDYYKTAKGEQIITISDLGNWKYELLIALHEIVESALCHDRGITDKSIDNFDMAYEEARKSSDKSSEPGNQPEAPYHTEHQFATKIERMVAEELEVDWNDYSQACITIAAN